MSDKFLMLRRAVLLQLYAVFPAGLPPSTILEGLRLAGFDCGLDDVQRNLEYLGRRA